MSKRRICVWLGPRSCVVAMLCMLATRRPADAQDASASPAARQLTPHRLVRAAALVDGYDLQFRQLTAEGLAQTRVAQIAQDSRGFLWFGTPLGLYRYDGYELRSYRHDAGDENSLSGVYVYSLLRDNVNSLWIGSDGFVDRFDPRTERFTSVPILPERDSVAAINASCLNRDAAGMLWLCTRGGLYRVDPERGKAAVLRHNATDHTSLSSDEIQFLGDGPRGTMWVGSAAGLDQLDPTSLRVLERLSLGTSPTGMSVHEGRDGLVWIIHGIDGELSSLDRAADQLVTWRPIVEGGSAPVSFSAMLEDREGTLWFGTRNHGLLKFDRSGHRFIRYTSDPSHPHSLSDRRVNVLFQDREGLIWAGLHQSAPNYFLPHPTSFQSIRPTGRQSTLVSAILRDGSGLIWLGLDRGVRTLDRSSWTIREVAALRDVETTSIVQESPGILWFGTAGRGVWRLDQRTGHVRRYRRDPQDDGSLPSDFVEQLRRDRQGRVWAVTWRGLARWDSTARQFTRLAPTTAPPELTLHTATFAKSGVVWIGSNLGVHRFDPVTGRFDWYRHSNRDRTSLSNDRVNTIHEASDGTIWIGTQGGLDHWDANARPLGRYTQRDGLPGSTVSCILEDGSHQLWMSTEHGIARLSTATGAFKSYGTADGLPGANLTGWDTCERDTSGEMLFAGFAGATAFFPNKVLERDYLPPVVLTGFRLLDSRMEVDGKRVSDLPVYDGAELRLGPAQGRFSVEFAALSYLSPESNRLRFRLRGLQEQWTEVRSDQRVATFLAVPTGTFIFEVQGATGHGRWSPAAATLRIVKLPSWWESRPFFLLSSLCVAAALVVAYRLRIRQLTHAHNVRMEARWAERTRIARELHDTLLQGFQGLMFRLQAVRELLPAQPAKAVPVLDQTLVKGEQAIDEARRAVRDLRSVERTERSLEAQLSALASTAAQLSNAHAPSWELVTKGYVRSIPASVVYELYQSTQEAISNAFQHAQARHVTVELDYGPSRLRISVLDDGVGFDSTRQEPNGLAPHFGIQGMRERIERLRGDMTLSSEPGAGTRVELSVPAAIAYADAAVRRRGSWLPWSHDPARRQSRD